MKTPTRIQLYWQDLGTDSGFAYESWHGDQILESGSVADVYDMPHDPDRSDLQAAVQEVAWLAGVEIIESEDVAACEHEDGGWAEWTATEHEESRDDN